jgi:hypothetical protein
MQNFCLRFYPTSWYISTYNFRRIFQGKEERQKVVNSVIKYEENMTRKEARARDTNCFLFTGAVFRRNPEICNGAAL